jgi:hypothetical protein
MQRFHFSKITGIMSDFDEHQRNKTSEIATDLNGIHLKQILTTGQQQNGDSLGPALPVVV